MKLQEGAFSLKNYRFVSASLNFEIPDNANLSISISTKGSFSNSKKEFLINFDVVVSCEEEKIDVIKVTCIANYVFSNNISFESIPVYFYPNSLAIIFPYVRAFVSTLSLQANVQPIVLPTVNLSNLKEELKNNTKVID